MIDREAAWCLLTEFTQSESLRKHALAVEACMRACAESSALETRTPQSLGYPRKTSGASSASSTTSTTKNIPASKTIPTKATKF
jgi:hypothetical protein